MKYLALYRKYRPKTFDEISGQQVIVKTLKNIIKNDKLTHSYLFIGPRGTGKTSIAKIFAKTINCENSKDGCSCEKCSCCKSNNTNENIDIIEMDAASNNGVDEIREIKNHVTLLPSSSKYKIYIIDEVHMLTTGAFNALLKTLEEPPQHVIFILATTEPQKIPLTIKSRCQSFEFKPIPKSIMNERLKYICEKEKINIDDEALNMISESSNGGMRDAISLLDQINAYSDGNIKEEDVVLLNGRISSEQIEKFFDFALESKYEECFEYINEIEKLGKEFTYICEDVIKYIRDNLLDNQISNQNEFIKKCSRDKCIDIISILNDCILQMKNTNDKRIYFDLCLIKIFDILNKQTNVYKKIKIESVEESKIDIQKKEEKKETKTKEKENDEKNDIFKQLMDVRLNNILATADKKSLLEYEQFFKGLSNNLTNLDDLKIVNILSDCLIKAGSSNGLVITVDNNNLLIELYENYECIEKIVEDNMNKKINVCVLFDDDWNDKRNIYVKKIKNKEKIEYIDEKYIIEKLEKINKKNKSEFEDLLEIGE